MSDEFQLTGEVHNPLYKDLIQVSEELIHQEMAELVTKTKTKMTKDHVTALAKIERHVAVLQKVIPEDSSKMLSGPLRLLRERRMEYNRTKDKSAVQHTHDLTKAVTSEANRREREELARMRNNLQAERDNFHKYKERCQMMQDAINLADLPSNQEGVRPRSISVSSRSTISPYTHSVASERDEFSPVVSDDDNE